MRIFTPTKVGLVARRLCTAAADKLLQDSEKRKNEIISEFKATSYHNRNATRKALKENYKGMLQDSGKKKEEIIDALRTTSDQNRNTILNALKENCKYLGCIKRPMRSTMAIRPAVRPMRSAAHRLRLRSYTANTPPMQTWSKYLVHMIRKGMGLVADNIVMQMHNSFSSIKEFIKACTMTYIPCLSVLLRYLFPTLPERIEWLPSKEEIWRRVSEMDTPPSWFYWV